MEDLLEQHQILTEVITARYELAKSKQLRINRNNRQHTINLSAEYFELNQKLGKFGFQKDFDFAWLKQQILVGYLTGKIITAEDIRFTAEAETNLSKEETEEFIKNEFDDDQIENLKINNDFNVRKDHGTNAPSSVSNVNQRKGKNKNKNKRKQSNNQTKASKIEINNESLINNNNENDNGTSSPSSNSTLLRSGEDDINVKSMDIDNQENKIVIVNEINTDKGKDNIENDKLILSTDHLQNDDFNLNNDNIEKLNVLNEICDQSIKESIEKINNDDENRNNDRPDSMDNVDGDGTELPSSDTDWLKMEEVVSHESASLDIDIKPINQSSYENKSNNQIIEISNDEVDDNDNQNMDDDRPNPVNDVDDNGNDLPSSNTNSSEMETFVSCEPTPLSIDIQLESINQHNNDNEPSPEIPSNYETSNNENDEMPSSKNPTTNHQNMIIKIVNKKKNKIHQKKKRLNQTSITSRFTSNQKSNSIIAKHRTKSKSNNKNIVKIIKINNRRFKQRSTSKNQKPKIEIIKKNFKMIKYKNFKFKSTKSKRPNYEILEKIIDHFQKTNNKQNKKSKYVKIIGYQQHHIQIQMIIIDQQRKKKQRGGTNIGHGKTKKRTGGESPVIIEQIETKIKNSLKISLLTPQSWKTRKKKPFGTGIDLELGWGGVTYVKNPLENNQYACAQKIAQ